MRLVTLLVSWHIWHQPRSWVPSLAEAMPPACSFLHCLGENQPKSEHKQKQQEAGRLVRSLCL